LQQCLESILEELNSEQKNPLPYSPWVNGQVEKLNCTIKNHVISTLYEQDGCWDEHLPDLEFKYNNRPHQSTGFTPFQIEGIESFRIKNDEIATALGLSQIYLLKETPLSQEQIYEYTLKNLKRSAIESKARHDSNIKQTYHLIGEEVLVRDPKEKKIKGKRRYHASGYKYWAMVVEISQSNNGSVNYRLKWLSKGPREGDIEGSITDRFYSASWLKRIYTPNNIKLFSINNDNTQQHSTTFNNIQQHPTTFNNIQQHSTTPNNTQQHSATFNNIQQHSTIFNNTHNIHNIQQHPTTSNNSDN
jgi:hypothetical protein